MPTIFPSLEAFKAAKAGRPIPAASDPLAAFCEREKFGWWTTGAIQAFDPKPLPVLVEIKDRPGAVKLVRAGGRPLADSDPELIAMIRDFYAGKDVKDVPAALRGIIEVSAPPPPAPAPAPAAKKVP